MRTIKFRAKKTTNDVWVYGSLVYSNDLDAAIYFQKGNGSVKSMDWVYVNPETIGQFTGLLDANGTEIYEGDLVISQFNKFPLGIVTWHTDGYFFIDCSFGKNKNFGDGFTPLGELMKRKIGREYIYLDVIGNIHDNPQLINK